MPEKTDAGAPEWTGASACHSGLLLFFPVSFVPFPQLAVGGFPGWFLKGRGHVQLVLIVRRQDLIELFPHPFCPMQLDHIYAHCQPVDRQKLVCIQIAIGENHIGNQNGAIIITSEINVVVVVIGAEFRLAPEPPTTDPFRCQGDESQPVVDA